jgi:anti-anti-sigma factor
MLSVTIEDLGGTVILRCLGRIVRGDETAVLCAAVRRHGQDIILDLRGVDAIDAAGMSALISLQAAGIYLKLMDPTKRVREALTITGLDSIFEIRESKTSGEEAGKSLTASVPTAGIHTDLTGLLNLGPLANSPSQ